MDFTINLPRFSRRHPYVVLAIAFVIWVWLWEWAARDHFVDMETWSCPTEIAQSLAHDFGAPITSPGDQNSSKTLLPHVAKTLGRFIAGFLGAASIGVAVGFVMSISKPLHSLLSPIVNVLRSLPSAAVWPVGAVILGYGIQSQMFVILFGATWPILVYTTKGVGALRHEVHDSLQFMSMEWFRRWWVLLLWSLPSIMTGLEVGCAIAFLLTVTMEILYPGSGGLGWYLQYHLQYSLEPDRLFAGLLLVAGLGWLANTGMALLRKRLIYWEGDLREIVRQKPPKRLARVLNLIRDPRRRKVLTAEYVTREIEQVYSIDVSPVVLYQGTPYMFPDEYQSELGCIPFKEGVIQRDITISAPAGEKGEPAVVLFARSWIKTNALTALAVNLIDQRQLTIGRIVRQTEKNLGYKHLWYRERISDKLGRIFGAGGTVHVIQRSRLIAIAEKPAILIEEFVPV